MWDKEQVHDEMKSFLIEGAKLTEHGFPVIEPCYSIPKDVVAWGDHRKEGKECKQKALHFYVDDYRYSGFWKNPYQYFGVCSMFGWTITPDYTIDADMPLVMQQWQVYRSRALGYWMQDLGLNVIPSVTWTADVDSYEWCFEGLPRNSVVAVSTNGCHSKEAKEVFSDGFRAMEHELRPSEVIIVGKPIELDTWTPIHYFKSHGQLMAEAKKRKAVSDEQNTAQNRF